METTEEVPGGRMLSAEEVTVIIKNKLQNSNFELMKYSFENLEQKVGLLGDHCLLRATVKMLEEHGSEDQVVKQEFSFFAKLFPAYRGPAEFVEGLRAFEKEIFMYDLFDKFKNYNINLVEFCTASCYLSQYNRYLIMDNLFLEGYQALDKYKTLDYQTLITVIKGLAKLHASSIIYEEKKSKELTKQYRLNQEYEREFGGDFLQQKRRLHQYQRHHRFD